MRGLGCILAGTLVLIVTNSLACVGAEERESREFRFASVEAGRSILSSKDAFVQRMSAFDRKVRLQKEIDPGEEAAFAICGSTSPRVVRGGKRCTEYGYPRTRA